MSSEAYPLQSPPLNFERGGRGCEKFEDVPRSPKKQDVLHYFLQQLKSGLWTFSYCMFLTCNNVVCSRCTFMLYIRVVFSCCVYMCIYVVVYMLCILTVMATSGARTVVSSVSPPLLDVTYTQPVVRYPPPGCGS